MAKQGESGLACTKRLLRATLCDCGDPAMTSRPRNDGSGRYDHVCARCEGGRLRITHAFRVLTLDDLEREIQEAMTA